MLDNGAHLVKSLPYLSLLLAHHHRLPLFSHRWVTIIPSLPSTAHHHASSAPRAAIIVVPSSSTTIELSITCRAITTIPLSPFTAHHCLATMHLRPPSSLRLLPPLSPYLSPLYPNFDEPNRKTIGCKILVCNLRNPVANR
ncbi:inositol 5-phosphatase [Sesbania bispinosa]|nr:inositol 5-phosphatase [Sesbania bispinosa]